VKTTKPSVSRPPDRDLNPGLPEYKAGALTTRLRSSIRLYVRNAQNADTVCCLTQLLFQVNWKCVSMVTQYCLFMSVGTQPELKYVDT
jgi:hypothetical protein